MEIIGFIFLTVILLYVTFIVVANLFIGGGDLGPLLTGWVPWYHKVLGIIYIITAAFLWYLLYLNAPFEIIIK